MHLVNQLFTSKKYPNASRVPRNLVHTVIWFSNMYPSTQRIQVVVQARRNVISCAVKQAGHRNHDRRQGAVLSEGTSAVAASIQGRQGRVNGDDMGCA
jgi:hypothetical protein